MYRMRTFYVGCGEGICFELATTVSSPKNGQHPHPPGCLNILDNNIFELDCMLAGQVLDMQNLHGQSHYV